MELKNFYAQDVNGNIVPGAACTVYLQDRVTLATGLKDAAGSDLANPFVADVNGLAQFAAPNGKYFFRCVAGLMDSMIAVQFADPSEIYPLITQAQTAATQAMTAASQAALYNCPSFQSYADLRAFTGTDPVIHVTGQGIEGFFGYNPGTDDNGITVGNYKRLFSGPINVTWFGAIGDNSYDNASAFGYVNAVIGTYKSVYFPPGKYKTSAIWSNSTEGVTLYGDNPWTTSIIQTNLGLGVVSNTAMFFEFRGLCIDYAGTPTASQALYSSGSYSVLDNYLIRRGYDCVLLETGVAQRSTNFNLLNYEFAGIRVRNLNDPFMDNFIINAGDNVKGRDGGIFLEEKVEALMCSNGDVLLGVKSFDSKVTTYGMNTRPAYNKFSNVFFDSAVNGAIFDKMVETDFVDCWWSGGRSSTPTSSQPGATFKTVDSIRVIGGQSFNCGSHGSLVRSMAKNVSFTNHSFESNSATAGDGVADGLNVESGAIGCTIIGGKASNGLYTGKQGYGINVGAACADFSIIGVNLKGNLTGPMLDSSATSVSKTIFGNQGYVTRNKGTGTVIVGQTVVTITHGLSKTPTASDISLSFAGNPTASGVTSLYVAAINSTTFQIVTNTAVVTNALQVSWRADIS
uniref:Pectate lyase superfamily protein domain-containing protein n=4 Tax=unclassified bacterial viruses TaxID=12333 RepID=A0AAU6W3V7_9VIRU